MLKSRRMLGAALALTAGVAMVGVGPAGAAKGPPKPKGKVLCTTITGTVTGTITISGCSGTANTGSSTQPVATSSLISGGTIHWVNGKTTTISAATLVETKAKKCPGYVKPPKGSTSSSNPTAEKVSGTVNADTSGMKVPGKFKGAVCISQSGNITALKPLKAN
jgi:hypothetical protein